MLTEQEKIRLLTARTELEKSAKMYRELLHSTESQLRDVDAQLDSNYDGGRNYTDAEVRSVRQAIRLAVVKAGSSGLQPLMLEQECHSFDGHLVRREAHKLASDSRSDICHNGRKGPAARFLRRAVA